MKSDASAFCSYEEYETAVANLKETLKLRGESINGQLNGTLPNTIDEQSQNPDLLISCDEIELSKMGGMGGKGNRDLQNNKGNNGKASRTPNGMGDIPDMQNMQQKVEINSSMANKQVILYIALGVITVIAAIIVSAIECSQNSQKVDSDYTELYNETINTRRIEETIKELTLEKYEDRLTGTKGNELAVEYIVDQFEKIGLENPNGIENYRQNYTQRVGKVNRTPKLKLVDDKGNLIKEYKYMKDFTILTTWPNIRLQGDVLAPGYQVNEYRNYEVKEVKGKFGIIPIEMRNKFPDYESFAAGVLNVSLLTGSYGVIVEKALNTEDYLYTKYPVAPNVLEFTSENDKGPMVYYVSTPVFNEIKEETSKGVLVHVFIDCSINEVQASNVIGYIKGSDKKLKDEYIIISAHLDHVGTNGDNTYNPGALDKGSGIASILEIAKIIKEQKIKPKKSIVFIAFNGEEEGKIGSLNYVKKPVFPLEKSVVINLDMVGSKKVIPLTIESYDDKNVALREEFIKGADKMGIDCKADIGNRSDHGSFGKNGVPAVNLTNYDLEGYHTPEDTIDKVDSNRVKKVAELVLYYLASKAY